jgi:transcription antitermination factor NusG
LTACQAFTTDFLSGQLGPTVLEASWFAMKTRSRFEKKVTFELQEKGIETFLPLHSVKRQWSDRRQIVSVPLFSGYAFARITSDQATRIQVLRTNGVVGFVGSTFSGTPIPDEEIEAIRQVLREQIPFSLHPYVKVGQNVRIRGGALDGIKGILTKVNGDHSLIVSVELIQRSVAMRVTGYEIEPD